MIHTLFIIDKNGEIIIERHWRGRVSRSVGEKFWEEVKKTGGKPENVPPVICTPKHYVIHIHKHELFFVGVVHGETPPLMVIELLYKIVETFERYIGKVNDFGIKQNFVTVYQLLDEMIDNGFPITTELSLLQDLVKPPQSLLQTVGNIVAQPNAGSGRSPVPWRKLGIRYTNNEIFFDFVEEMNCIVDVNGMLTYSEILGVVKCNCKLSGMPDLLMQFKDPSLIEDSAFHPCVRYARFDQDRAISFVPPDGPFDLLSYRLTNITFAPLYCRPQIIFHPGGINMNIMAGLKPQNLKALEDVRVIIPVPCTIDAVKVNCSVGQMTVDNAKKQLVWSIGTLSPSMKDSPSASGSVTFASRQEDISSNGFGALIQFKMSQTAISDIKVEAVHVKNEKYKPFKGVRYMAQSGRYEVRTC